MAKYIMAIKGKGVELNSVIWHTQAQTMSEAKDYFVRLKNLPEKEFDKLFVVAEVSEEGIDTTRIVKGGNNDDDSIDIPGNEWVDEDED